MVKVKESLVGKQFGRLIVIEQVEDYVSPKGKHRAKYLCKCTCCDDKYATVFLLRKKGVNIVSTSETSVNRWCERVTYTRYILQEGNSNDKQTVA